MKRAGCAVAGARVLVVAVVLAGALTPGYSPWSDTVSRLGSSGQPYAFATRAAFVVYGLLTAVGAAAVARGAAVRWSVRLYCAAAVVAGVAPKDAPGVPHTVASQVHVGATLLGGGAVMLAMAVVTRGGARRAEPQVELRRQRVFVRHRAHSSPHAPRFATIFRA